MSAISATDLKAGGVTAIEQAMTGNDPVIINVRGKARYAVIDMNQYHTFREMELDRAISESESDLKAGNFDAVEDIETYTRKLADEFGIDD